MDDEKRCLISRWRLSNHKLYIETGRYNNPPIPREDRKCVICNVLEDEHHAIFICPTFSNIRMKFADILNKYRSIKSILNPDINDAVHVANLIDEIDKKLAKR